MSVLRKYIAFLLLLTALAANATGDRMLKLIFNDESTLYFQLTESTTMNISEGSLKIMSDKLINVYSLESLKYYSFENVSSVSEITKDKTFLKFHNGNLIISLNNIPSVVAIYNTNGQVVKKTNVTSPEIAISSRDMSPGVYMVKVGETVHKILITK